MTISEALLWFVLELYGERSFHVELEPTTDQINIWIVAD
jgi:hypothetical protein